MIDWLKLGEKLYVKVGEIIAFWEDDGSTYVMVGKDKVLKIEMDFEMLKGTLSR